MDKTFQKCESKTFACQNKILTLQFMASRGIFNYMSVKLSILNDMIVYFE